MRTTRGKSAAIYLLVFICFALLLVSIGASAGPSPMKEVTRQIKEMEPQLAAVYHLTIPQLNVLAADANVDIAGYAQWALAMRCAYSCPRAARAFIAHAAIELNSPIPIWYFGQNFLWHGNEEEQAVALPYLLLAEYLGGKWAADLIEDGDYSDKDVADATLMLHLFLTRPWVQPTVLP